MTVKEHYDNHLGNFNSWMAGDFDIKQKEFELFLTDQSITPGINAYAIDLGAGHGIQSVALARLGYKVKAIDFNKQLLTELMERSKGYGIEIIEDEILSFEKYAPPQPELIVCWGDTLTHLESEKDIGQLITSCCEALVKNGKLMLSFRDYSNDLTGDSRFIQVKNDHDRILTCFLEYFPGHVCVTDLLYEKEITGWKQKVSSYHKVRITPAAVKLLLGKLRDEHSI